MVINKILSDIFGQDVSVSKKTLYGDYSLNIYNLNNKDITINHPFIKSYSIENNFLNIEISDDLIIVDGNLTEKIEYRRMLQLRKRLYIEGYTEGVSELYKPLVKRMNEYYYSKEYSLDYDESIILKTFDKIDLGLIYRKQTKEELGGMYLVLNSLLRMVD